MKILTPNLVLDSGSRHAGSGGRPPKAKPQGDHNSRGVRGHALLGIFCFIEGFRCFLVISKGTF